MFKSMRLAGSIAVLCVGQFALAAGPFSLTSSSFKDGTMLSVKNAGNFSANPNCIGENISPQLSWSNMPTGTKSLALLLVDPEAHAGLGFIHMVAYGIAPAIAGFAEGELSQPSNKFVSGKNGAGRSYYQGPCIPQGIGMHHYTFTLIATDLDPSELPAGLTRDELFAKIARHAKGSAGLVGLFGRP